MQVGCHKELRLFMYPTAACQTKSVYRKQSTWIFPETFKCDFPKAPMNRATRRHALSTTSKGGVHPA